MNEGESSDNPDVKEKGCNVWFYTTRFISRGKTSPFIIIPAAWGFVKGELIDVDIRKINSPKWFRVTKTVSKVASSLGIYVSSKWGFQADELVVYRVRRIAENTGIDIEGEDQGIIEY